MYVARTVAIFILTFVFCVLVLPFVEAQANPDIQYIRNEDIGFNISDVQRSDQWDYILKSNLCFDFNPPSTGGSYAVQLVMDLTTGEKVIGASVSQRITNPSTTRCDSRTLRRLISNAPFNIPDQDLWKEECPVIKVRVVTGGSWRPIPQADVAYIGRSFLCPDGPADPAPIASPKVASPTPRAAAPRIVPSVTPTPTRRFTARPIVGGPGSPTSAPTTVPSAPTSTPTPTPQAISGRVTVFSCAQPENVTLSYCDDTAGTSCSDISLQPAEANQSVWLDDETNERTFIYKYKITQDKAGNPLDPSKKYVVFNANARIKRFKDTTVDAFASLREDKKEVSVPGTRDLTIHAGAQTCSCVFHARAHVRDADTGEITTALDEQIVPGKELTYGTANDLQIISRGDKPVSPFTNGVLDVNESLHDLNYSPKVGPWTPYGVDGMAYVRLYAPGYAVVKQRCVTTPASQLHACPGGALEYEQTFTDEKSFLGFRVACGVDVSYDWYIRKAAGTSELLKVTKPENVDINKDGFINTADLVSCIDEWGQKGKGLTCDINKDSSVDALDLSLVTSLQGTDVTTAQ